MGSDKGQRMKEVKNEPAKRLDRLSSGEAVPAVVKQKFLMEEIREEA
ncbi:hypothetical protein J4466_03540 [Candidatus Pacearchaeota archaeon]|nr:hypothetical protein [Candidatus Pacearchaeota archaeon]